LASSTAVRETISLLLLLSLNFSAISIVSCYYPPQQRPEKLKGYLREVIQPSYAQYSSTRGLNEEAFFFFFFLRPFIRRIGVITSSKGAATWWE
jgi:hypothetical protein